MLSYSQRTIEMFGLLIFDLKGLHGGCSWPEVPLKESYFKLSDAEFRLATTIGRLLV